LAPGKLGSRNWTINNAAESVAKGIYFLSLLVSITAADTQTEQTLSKIDNNEISLFPENYILLLWVQIVKNNVYNGKKMLTIYLTESGTNNGMNSTKKTF